jgi:hypothetical protein
VRAGGPTEELAEILAAQREAAGAGTTDVLAAQERAGIFTRPQTPSGAETTRR